MTARGEGEALDAESAVIQARKLLIELVISISRFGR
jgi:hypothetical protein